MICLWAVRLAWHIGARHKGEDYRYVHMRKRWMEKSERYYYIAAFTYIWMMQALFSLVVNSSALYVSLYSTGDELLITDYIGISVWVFGFLFEVIGDC